MTGYNAVYSKKGGHAMENKIEILKDIIKNSGNIVFFGGAGVSTESGIPDFRSADGLYSQKYEHPPEVMISHTFFRDNTKEFYDFYKSKMIFREAKPNKAHIALAKLESAGKLKAVITQNIDGLHQMAGSKNVLELHGSVYRNYCMDCGKFYDINAMLGNGVPACVCGGIIKPDVVLYEESLNNETIEKAVNYISLADVLIVGGTSLSVYPAAGLINYYSGNKLVLINKSVTAFDERADLLISEGIGYVLGEVASPDIL
jgi:NAD-dependent deacetylase